MTSMVLDGFESEEFLSDVGADQLFSFPSRDIEVCLKNRK